MGWGDEIVAAGQAQRIYDANPSLRVAICDTRAQPRWHPIWDGNPILATPDQVALGEPVQTVISAPHARPYIVYPFTKDSGWTFNSEFKCRDHVAQIYLTAEERARGTQARSTYGPYVLIEPYTKHDNFRWPLARWQAVVDACPEIAFVQHTHRDSPTLHGVHRETATFREACGLLTGAALYVRSESGLCHAAAALGISQVTVFGACMDPEVMAGYRWQHVIVSGEPCGSWLPCAHCADAMDRITVEQVVTAIRQQMGGACR